MALIASCAAVTVLMGIFVLRPLFGKSADNLDVEFMDETERDRLMDRKTAIYGNLKDLAFEYEMGRLTDEDFHQLEADYKTDAAVMLQKLEQLDTSGHSGKNVDATDQPEQSGNETRCPSCGAGIIPGKKFCADCGHKL